MNRIIQKFTVGLLISIVGLGSEVYADAPNNTQIARYLTVANQSLTAQANLLQQTFQVRFPVTVKTVGDAVCYLLEFSGYRLADENSLIPDVIEVLQQPLPQVDRTLGPLSLQDGLLTLVGNSFGLLVDPVYRLVSFRLLPAYQTLYAQSNSAPAVIHAPFFPGSAR